MEQQRKSQETRGRELSSIFWMKVRSGTNSSMKSGVVSMKETMDAVGKGFVNTPEGIKRGEGGFG